MTLRNILLVKAAEEHDPNYGIIPADARAEATRIAAPLPSVEREGDLAAEEAGFLGRRADWLLAYLRRKGQAGVLHWPTGILPGWVWWFLLLGAVLLGMFLAGPIAGANQQLNVLQLPVFGVLLWNLTVYALVLIQILIWLSRGKWPESGPLASLQSWLQQRGQIKPSANPVHHLWEAGMREDAAQFAARLRPLYQARLELCLHLAAAFLAAGAVAGKYWHGWATEYQAVWESTLFQSPATLGSFIGGVLGPASWLTGQEIPLASLPAMQRGAAGFIPQSALPWLHLYAGTLVIFVVIPRLLLAAFTAWRIAGLKRALRPGAELRPYLLGFLPPEKRAHSQEASPVLTVAAIPHGFEPDHATRERVKKLADAYWKTPFHLHWESVVPYGDEEDFLAKFAAPPGPLIALFNLSSTPEPEIQGELCEHLRRHFPAVSQDKKLLVLLDGAAFTRRLEGMSEAPLRLQQRQSAWKSVVGECEVLAS